MNRITGTFLVLLALATFASGQLWMQGRPLAADPMTALNGVIVVVNTVLLLVTLLGLGRILYKTAKVITVVGTQEDGDA